jgi:dTDP-4-dehydrorhamnose reductase
MRAIREYQPEARLIQTDDLSVTFSTPDIRYQADFENERRWLTWDLLCGRVSHGHSMRRFLVERGASQTELDWFVHNACPPSIIGINHYVTSDRFLDTNLHHYPSHTHGGNGLRSYADVEAARVRLDGTVDPGKLLLEAWKRYQIPLALTEVHHGCTREEQLRWLLEMWRGAEHARELGADVRAFTIWSLLGAFDWDSLVTLRRDHYEAGAFDIRGPQPRATAIAKVATRLVANKQVDHALLEVPGWWRRPQRLVHGVVYDDYGTQSTMTQESPDSHITPLLITGGRGTLGSAFARACVLRGIPHRVLLRSEADIADADSVRRAIDRYRPWAIINTAGYVRVDDAEQDRDACFRENTLGPTILAQECEGKNIRLVTFSSDLIFNGSKFARYVEPDSPAPLNVYGESKLLAEIHVLNTCPSALVIRTSAFFGPWDEYNFVYTALRALAENRRFRAAADATVSPTYVPDLVNCSLDLLVDEEQGVWHLANVGALTWADVAERSALLAGLNPSLIERCETRDLRLPARRPLFSALASCRTQSMPPIDDALHRFMLARNCPESA